MFDLTFQLHGDDTVTLDDMGGTLILSQHSEVSGRMERVVIEWGQLLQAVEAVRPRYGIEGAKSTSRATEPAVLDI